MGKIKLSPYYKTAPVFRKIAMGSWQTCHEASVYAQLDIDMSKAIPFMEEYNRKYNVKVSPAHLMGMAFRECIKARPEINGIIRGRKIYLREHVNLFFTVNIPAKEGDKVGKAILSGATVENAENMTLADVVRNLQSQAEIIRERRDKKFEKNFDTFKWIPWCLSGFFLKFVSWLTYGINLNVSWLGIPKDPFGSVLITNVGSLGIEHAYAPLIAYSRVPILVSVGALRDMPFVIDKQVVARPGMTMCVTFDHRFMDGAHSAQMSKIIKDCFANPEKYFA